MANCNIVSIRTISYVVNLKRLYSIHDLKNACTRVFLDQSIHIKNIYHKLVLKDLSGIGMASTCEETTSEIAPIGTILQFCR